MSEIIIISVASAVFIGWGIGDIACRIKLKLEERRSKALQNAYARGVSVGLAHHANFMRRVHECDVVGFGQSCNHCNRVVGVILQSKKEYFTCPNCGHRNPAPLLIP